MPRKKELVSNFYNAYKKVSKVRGREAHDQFANFHILLTCLYACVALSNKSLVKMERKTNIICSTYNVILYRAIFLTGIIISRYTKTFGITIQTNTL